MIEGAAFCQSLPSPPTLAAPFSLGASSRARATGRIRLEPPGSLLPMSLSSIAVFEPAGPLLTLAVVILVAMPMGAIARRAHLPSVTGQILAGLLLGRAGLDLFSEGDLHSLQPLTHFALGLMAMTVGAHLNVRRLRNAGKRLLFLLITEATVTPLLVFTVIWGVSSTPPGVAALFATCAIATAPATVVAIVAESRAKGVFVKTLIAAVALNNMVCIVFFELARALQISLSNPEAGLTDFLFLPGRQMLFAVLLGGLVAVLLEVVARYVGRSSDRLATLATVGLVLTSGLATYLDLSPLLACLFLGLVQTNLSRARDKLVDTVFADFQPVILAVFFTLAGMHLSLEHVAIVGLVATLLFASRIVGKLSAAYLALKWARAPANVRRNLGLALTPQAGVAVALVILIQDDPACAGIAELFSTVVLTVVVANEIVGPILARIALVRSGETGMDRTRLIDFIQEENIVVDFNAATKREAIGRLVQLMSASHHLSEEDRLMLLETTLRREEEASTCLGGGLSVPHGILPRGQSMVGVMGISKYGIPLDTPDGHPVHCMVLLGTSNDERDRHLQVLAALARTIGTDPSFRAQLFNARSPAHASELLHGEESVDFNYFLDDDGRA